MQKSSTFGVACYWEGNKTPVPNAGQILDVSN